jgi:hypothetical protein
MSGVAESGDGSGTPEPRLTCQVPGASMIVVNQEPIYSQYLKPGVGFAAVAVALLLLTVPAASGQTPKPSQPDPVKFLNKYEVVFNVVRSVLLDAGYNIQLEDRKGGSIVTKPYEFITGSLTSSEVDKVALKKDTITGDWIRARYTVDALIEIVTPAETMLTVRTRFEGLNREIDGTEKWLALESLGVIEKRIMGKVSMKLMGNELQYNEKKGFWDKSPAPADGRRPDSYPTRPPL